ncbi:hypothetical protein BU15DRAFT_63623 [Melanogaster broomeanus]|nr:hypothetical protein BU15DRAFT_63623 [Melanogaster broomeanus]
MFTESRAHAASSESYPDVARGRQAANWVYIDVKCASIPSSLYHVQFSLCIILFWSRGSSLGLLTVHCLLVQSVVPLLTLHQAIVVHTTVRVRAHESLGAAEDNVIPVQPTRTKSGNVVDNIRITKGILTAFNIASTNRSGAYVQDAWVAEKLCVRAEGRTGDKGGDGRGRLPRSKVVAEDGTKDSKVVLYSPFYGVLPSVRATSRIGVTLGTLAAARINEHENHVGGNRRCLTALGRSLLFALIVRWFPLPIQWFSAGQGHEQADVPYEHLCMSSGVAHNPRTCYIAVCSILSLATSGSRNLPRPRSQLRRLDRAMNYILQVTSTIRTPLMHRSQCGRPATCHELNLACSAATAVAAIYSNYAGMFDIVCGSVLGVTRNTCPQLKVLNMADLKCIITDKGTYLTLVEAVGNVTAAPLMVKPTPGCPTMQWGIIDAGAPVGLSEVLAHFREYMRTWTA